MKVKCKFSIYNRTERTSFSKLFDLKVTTFDPLCKTYFLLFVVSETESDSRRNYGAKYE